MAEVIYYWIAWDQSDWENPDQMVDGELRSFAVAPDIELCQGNTINTCEGENLGTITKVEIRGYGFAITAGNITFRPYFDISGEWGDIHPYWFLSSEAWSDWIKITDDTNAPDPWDWDWIQTLWMQVCSGSEPRLEWALAKLEVRVTYTPAPTTTPVAGKGLIAWTP